MDFSFFFLAFSFLAAFLVASRSSSNSKAAAAASAASSAASSTAAVLESFAACQGPEIRKNHTVVHREETDGRWDISCRESLSERTVTQWNLRCTLHGVSCLRSSQRHCDDKLFWVLLSWQEHVLKKGLLKASRAGKTLHKC